MRPLLRQKLLQLAAALPFAAFALTGCDDDREIIDVDTPGTDIEVEQDRDTGEVDVDVD